MSRLTWDVREYEIGIDRGVFYPFGGPAEAWNGLVSVDEQIADSSASVSYIDGVKVSNRVKESSFAASVLAHTYPPSFFVNPRAPFGFSYRTKTAKSYKIHLVYNALAHISDRKHVPGDTTPFGFDISTLPVAISGAKPSAHLIIDPANATSLAIEDFETLIYGDESADPRFPSPDEVIAVFEAHALFNVIDNGDGTFTVEGPDSMIHMLSDTEFELVSSSAVYIDDASYIVRSF